MSKEYKADEFEYFVEEPTGEYETTGAKGGSTRKRPIMKKIMISFDKIDGLDLEKRGEQVPFSHKHVVNTPLYLLYYWSPIIGDRACWLYLQMLSYCREERDFLWDKLEELEYRTKMTRPTLNKHLDILEQYNFCKQIHRLNKKNNNKQTSPLIKVRQTIPLISRAEYEQLSEKSQKKHDEFMDKYGKHSNMEELTYDSKETVKELVEDGEVRKTQKMKKKINKIMVEEKALAYIATKLEYSDDLRQDSFHQLVANNQNYFSKPMYDSHMRDTFLFYDRKYDVIDVVTSETAIMFFDVNKEHYNSKFEKVVEELYGLTADDYRTITYFTFEEYMYKLERGI